MAGTSSQGVPPGTAAGTDAPTLVDGTATPLRGRMGTVQLVLTVLAMASPLGAVAGVVPLVIAVGTGVGAAMTYVLVGLLLLLFAVGFTALSRALPRAGAFYTFVSAGLGRPPGLGAGFVALVGYLAQLVGAYAFLGAAVQVLVTAIGWGSVPWWGWSLVAWACAGVLGFVNVEFSGRVLSVLMLLEVAVVLCLDVPALLRGGPEGRPFGVFSAAVLGQGSLSLAILFAVSTFIGFEATAIYRSETRDPERTVPRATYAAVGLIALFYVFTAWSLTTAYGPSQVVAAAQADPTTLFTRALGEYAGPLVADTVSFLLVTSVFASILSSHHPISRYVFSLSRNRVLPAAFGRTHARHGSPAAASLLTSATSAVVVVPFVVLGVDAVNVYSWLFGIAAYALLVLLTLTTLAVVVHFRRARAGGGTGPVPGPWHTLVAPGLALVGLLATLGVVSRNFSALLGSGPVLADLLVLGVWAVCGVGVLTALVRRRRDPEAYALLGDGR